MMMHPTVAASVVIRASFNSGIQAHAQRDKRPGRTAWGRQNPSQYTTTASRDINGTKTISFGHSQPKLSFIKFGPQIPVSLILLWHTSPARLIIPRLSIWLWNILTMRDVLSCSANCGESVNRCGGWSYNLGQIAKRWLMEGQTFSHAFLTMDTIHYFLVGIFFSRFFNFCD